MSVRKRWILLDGKLLPEGEAYAILNARRRKGPDGPTVLGDIPPDQAFVSPVDGSLITSREELRQHNSRNSVQDVGNDPAYRNPKPPKFEMPDPRPMLRDLYNS